MTILEMQLKFNQLILNHVKIGIEMRSIDIEYYLNLAQYSIVDEFYAQYENNERARKILANLIYNVDLTRTSVANSQAGVHPHGEYWDLPTGLLYILKEEATINVDSCGRTTAVTGNYQRVYVKPINVDYYNMHSTNPFKKPYEGLVWRLDITNGNDRSHELITDGHQVYLYHVTYLKEPVDMSINNNVSCELMSWIHQDIVERAVKIAIEAKLANNELKKQ